MEARESLALMLGPEAEFRDGQLEAITAVAEPGSRVLVVQRTGWGKTLVYFIATRMIRVRGAGPTVVVSPLVSLMRNQLATAEAAGVSAAAITSGNRPEWETIRRNLLQGKTDLLLISPERLAYGGFRRDVLQQLPKGIGLLVIDEAHCISDWGHDFRPDYRRVARLMSRIQKHARVLATTGTANDRVVEDVRAQLGSSMRVLRGPLARESLTLQTIVLHQPTERLAWLADHLPTLPGSGIIYCLTRADTELVARWLRERGIDVHAYHAGLSHEERAEREGWLLANKCKALCATVALGMGFDKPDLAFVIHYQRPRSVVDYYQQVGRAGRALPQAYGILLAGAEDDAIGEYFASTGQPAAEEQSQVLRAVEAHGPVSEDQLAPIVNVSKTRLAQCLRLLRADDVVGWRDGRWYRRPGSWSPDFDRWARISAHRLIEMERMARMTSHDGCLMEYICRELDDPSAAPCGRCANCAGPDLPERYARRTLREADAAVKASHPEIQPRRQWPADREHPEPRPIEPSLRLKWGRALCVYGRLGHGAAVADGKFRRGGFGRALVRASAELIRDTWSPHPTPTWITHVPSRRRPRLVADFAQALARALGIQCREALVKRSETREQKRMLNSSHQLANVRDAFGVDRRAIIAGSPVLLVDDIVDSRWTLTVCGAKLLEAGSGPVFPFALAAATGVARP
ncbi:MAG: RecQ family ATP-dependent DNA helicase [Armatimonadia bacterium]|nr:RecQ family ATP-dependent DNA helicase [Armatimonadia bacterium]